MIHHTAIFHTAFASVILALVPPGHAGDWRQFRGDDHTSRSTARPPIEWDESKNIAFKAPLVGRGVSGPIVVGRRVFVTASSGVRHDRLHVLALDANSGEQLWHRQFWATGRTLAHPTSAIAAPTPASDGRRVFAFFSSNDLICLDLQGNLLWYRGLAHDYPKAGNDVGMASSPVVVDQTVVVQIECQGESFAAGLNTVTGASRWKIPRPRQANWASPVAYSAGPDDGSLVLLQSPSKLTAHDPRSGKRIWTYDERCGGIPSPTVVDGQVFVPSQGVTLLKPHGRSSESPRIAWRAGKLNPNACSPVVVDGKVYTVNRTVLVCGDAKTGKTLWQLRLSGGRYWATPVAAGGHLYVVNDAGKMDVVELNDTAAKAKIVARNDFDGAVLGSPAVAGDALFVRTHQYLWKIARGRVD